MTISFMVPSEQRAERQPLHVKISEQLKAKIESGEYAPGERLPSEFDLGASFSVSRTTVRRAIANLIRQGLVTTQQGKGIFVTQRHKISFSMSNPLMQFDQALRDQGYQGKVQSLRFQRCTASLDVARCLHLSGRSPQVYWQEKIIYADDYPIALDISYFTEAIGLALGAQLQTGFTYSSLTQNGVSLNEAEVRLESMPADYELSEYLAVPLGMPLLVFHYVAYTGKHEAIVCGKTLSRSDWTCYTAQIAKL